MLCLNDIRTFYGSIEALKGISLQVKEGEIVCLIGANGAGKSTVLMTISGILKPRSGSIKFFGKNFEHLPAHRIVSEGIVQVPEGRRIFPRLTVEENLLMGAFSQEDDEFIKEDMENVFELFPALKERIKQAGGTLSGGEQQMLSIGRALMARPTLLLLDEPSLGLAPKLVEKIFEKILEINSKGTTILLVEQNAHMALQISSRGYIMETGRIVLHGASPTLLSDESVRRAYLGD